MSYVKFPQALLHARLLANAMPSLRAKVISEPRFRITGRRLFRKGVVRFSQLGDAPKQFKS